MAAGSISPPCPVTPNFLSKRLEALSKANAYLAASSGSIFSSGVYKSIIAARSLDTNIFIASFGFVTPEAAVFYSSSSSVELVFVES